MDEPRPSHDTSTNPTSVESNSMSKEMTSQKPLRARPNLHLALAQHTGSPYNPHAPAPTRGSFLSPFQTPTTTPLATTSNSPFESDKSGAPSPSGRSMNFTPRQRHKYRHYGRVFSRKVKRILTRPATWYLVLVMVMMAWWVNGGSQGLDAVKLGAAGYGRHFFQNAATQGLQFFPPNNPKIHYVGRWTATPNQLRKDGTFPGVYFDICVTNTTSVFLSLKNAPEKPGDAAKATDTSTAVPYNGHISFRPESANAKPALPISLIYRTDRDDFRLHVNASGLVTIRSGTLKREDTHNIRVIATMTDDRGKGVFQLEGIWLSKGGRFNWVDRVVRPHDDDEDLLRAESDKVGEQHRKGLSQLLKGKSQDPLLEEPQEESKDQALLNFRDRKKLVEIITDNPGSVTRRTEGKYTKGQYSLLDGVKGWEYLLGEMFHVDHVAIGVDGMCLIQDCVGGHGQPNGIGDVFFRSGPPGTRYLQRPWLFNRDVPDLIVLNLGTSDLLSFERYAADYNTSFWDLSSRFEDTYVSLIKAIRTLAYPKHPALLQSERTGYKTHVPNSVSPVIPIFVMRPLRGELEHSGQNVVNRLRNDGDVGVFWLDTQGWLDPSVTSTPENPENRINEDYYLDTTADATSSSTSVQAKLGPKYRLTERGNQRTAIFLHHHMCMYLAYWNEKCAFIKHEVYEGGVFDPVERDFERYVQGEKERRLKELFWGESNFNPEVKPKFKVDENVVMGEEKNENEDEGLVMAEKSGVMEEDKLDGTVVDDVKTGGVTEQAKSGATGFGVNNGGLSEGNGGDGSVDEKTEAETRVTSVAAQTTERSAETSTIKEG